MQSFFDKRKIFFDHDYIGEEDFSSTEGFVICGSAKSKESNCLPMFVMMYEGKQIGGAWYCIQNKKIDIGYCFDANMPSIFFHTSIINTILSEASYRFSEHANALCFNSIEDVDVAEILENAGFVKEGEKRFIKTIDQVKANKLKAVKDNLLAEAKTAPKVGRGFVIDTAKMDQQALVLLNQEYNQIAWGHTQWARHEEIAADEMSILEKYVDQKEVLEIGAGAGRITRYLAQRARFTTATDYLPEIVQSLNGILGDMPNLISRIDDITESQLSDASFDLVLFLENGLGSILCEKKRAKAIEEMIRVLRPGGLLILGLRSLVDHAGDHLMIATQNPHIMGVYHTFLYEEMDQLLAERVKKLEFIVGGERPAGGRQFFVVSQKL